MTYAFTQDVPIDAEFYRRIVDGLGDGAPTGLIVHLAVELRGGGPALHRRLGVRGRRGALHRGTPASRGRAPAAGGLRRRGAARTAAHRPVRHPHLAALSIRRSLLARWLGAAGRMSGSAVRGHL